ncbi:hypothetical protein SAMN05421820_101882 [Pedobacter steynii]|uniref:Uncharacterized protein n=1 Tax=Pedobacter steynii TaxID=430522 RepID=A0A1G9LGG6_9SPHI|nr:hypothetical protein SAMN05421820_101882 [Pedobacter steynii]
MGYYTNFNSLNSAYKSDKALNSLRLKRNIKLLDRGDFF